MIEKKGAMTGGLSEREYLMSQLNDKARRILDYITKEIGDGVPPSVRKFALHCKSNLLLLSINI